MNCIDSARLPLSNYRLAGVAVGELESERFSEETQGRYGAIAIYERISLHLDWIRQVAFSESD